MTDLIDVCQDYIVSKGASYLAKEGKLVYYASLTGRKSDWKFHTQTITETLRIIKAMKLSPKDADRLQESHLIAALQELDKVYEFGVKSPHKVRPEVFNYFDHAVMDMGDTMMMSLVSVVESWAAQAILLGDVESIFNMAASKLKVNITARRLAQLRDKHFADAGYNILLNSQRPIVRGKRQRLVILAGAKPSDTIKLSPGGKMRAANSIVEAAK